MGGFRAAMLQCPRRVGYTTLLEPFTETMWFAFLFLWLLYSANLTFISYLSNRIQKLKFQRESKFSLWQSIWYFSIVSIQIGPDKHPKSLSGKVLTFFWCNFLLVMITSYTANLAAFLSKTPLEKPLKSVGEIVGSTKNVTTYEYLGPYVNQWENKVIETLFSTNRLRFELPMQVEQESIKKLRPMLESGKIWIAYDTHIEAMLKHFPRLYILDGYVSQFGYSFGMRKDWLWVERVNRVFMGFGRSGFFEEVNHRHTRHLRHVDVEDSIKQSMDLESYSPLLIIMLVVAVLSSVLMVFSYVQQKMGLNIVLHSVGGKMDVWRGIKGVRTKVQSTLFADRVNVHKVIPMS